MISLNDYLYNGDTVLKILLKYSADLKKEAIKTHNQIDLAHCNFLIQIIELLEHTDFLTSQSQRIKEFYMYMTEKYPFLAFTFKGRIKSLIRAEEKFNGYILEFIHEYYKAHGKYPNEAQIKNNLNCFRDLIAYRIVISLPQCHVMDGENLEDEEIKYLYDIANVMPGFLEERGFTAELSGFSNDEDSECISENNRMYYRDYVKTPRPTGYRSLHITFYDNFARCYTEVQLRTKDMDDQAEIGRANHFGYEKEQEENADCRKRLNDTYDGFVEKFGYLTEHVHSFEWGSKPSCYKGGKEIGKDLSKARPGDVICYRGHVAIYMGNGRIVHAADYKYGICISKNAAYMKILSIRRFF